MDFGKVQNIGSVAFQLPPDHEATAKVLSNAGPVYYLQPQVYIGCPTWNNKPWQGNYYPAGIAAKDQLYWYSRQFNTIELNSTHYGIPDTATVSRWRENVSPDFTFCPKLPQLISHELQLQNSQQVTHDFCESLLGLEQHLGCSFLQLSPVFGPGELEVLMQFLEAFPRSFPLALELRDADWFAGSSQFEALGALLEAYNLAMVITDVAGRRDVLHMRLTNTTAFIRFVGYGLHSSDYTRIDQWIKRLQLWFDLGLQKLYFFVHQENISHSPVLINYFIDQLERTCGIRVDKPKPLPQPVQGSLF